MSSPTAGVATLGKAPQSETRNRMVRWLVPLGLGVIILLVPRPAGLTPAAWHYFALFVTVIAALITEPIPGPALGFMGVSAASVMVLVGNTPADAMRWALSGFSNDTVWLIFAATMFAAGYEATGLGRRIALLLVKALGRKTLGLGYAIAISDLVLAPFMPSNTARSGGTIYPVVKNIPGLYDSSPTKNPRKIGAYLCWTAFMTTCVTSAMFLTGMAPNLLACELAKKIAHFDVTWTSWMMGFLPAGLLMFLATPLVVYLVYPPEIKEGEEVAKWAGSELTAMGPISRREITMACLAVLALVAWIFGARWIAAVTVALGVISLMILTKVVSWNDIMQNKQGWNILVWFATLVTMADGLSRVGFLEWFAKHSAGALAGIPLVPMMIALVALFFFVHYLFASTSAHTAAVLPVFLAVIVTVAGLPVKPVAMVMIYSIAIQGVLTPYATGPAPIWYSAGYISTKDFWRLGFIFGVFYLAILLLVALPYALRFMR
jgi:L-tartrate/succinate antiporter